MVQHALDAREGDARLINMAGRQRMLSQRLGMLALASQLADPARASQARDELPRAADEWEASLRGLRTGALHAGLGLGNPAVIEPLYAQIEDDHRAMLAAARAVAGDPVGTGRQDHALAVLDHERGFLAGMERIVDEYEREATRRIIELRRIEIALLVLLLLVLAFEGAFVFRPAVRGMRAHLAARDVAQNALEVSEAEKHAILRAFPDRLLVLSRDGSCVEIHADKTPPDTRRLTEILPGELAAACLARADHTLETGAVSRFESAIEHREYEGRLLRLPGERLLIVIRDITEIAHLERQLLQVSDHEQTRLAQDLHDGLSQHLIGIAFLLRSLRRELGSATARVDPRAEVDPRITARVDEIDQLLAEAIDQARGVARGLHTDRLEMVGLVAALGELATHTERVFGVECQVKDRAAGFDPPAAQRAHLHRIAREAVLNAAKHAGASMIEIELGREEAQFTLVVRDDGVGMGTRSQDGMGLHMMAYRAKVMGASLQIAAGEQRGTTVTCRVPVPDLATRSADA
ncbi:MAG TPA: type IV pili methyl-accepting chemotaxis transducer N-terminal domain-containing protein [Kofleriaceae bacterium]|nr:type IV pili methyl-accepting chemotaxis transducer N-terminal domain-containing protein [Kofleriaceae bacterium]